MPATLISGLEAVALVYKLNNGLVTRGLEELSEDDFWAKPGDRANPIGWILGHITESRATVLGELGEPMGLPWGERRFSRGGALVARSAYPERAVLEEAWRATGGRMRGAFAGLTPERLDAVPKKQGLPGVTNVATLIGFFAFHESYHVGQLGYARRLLGFKGIAD